MLEIGLATYKGHKEAIDVSTTFADLVEFGYRHDEWFKLSEMFVSLGLRGDTLAEWYKRAEEMGMADPLGAAIGETFCMIDLLED